MKMKSLLLSLAVLFFALVVSCKKSGSSSTATKEGWQVLGSFNPPYVFEQVAIDAGGTVYISGAYDTIGGSIFVWKWNGNEWTDVGPTGVYYGISSLIFDGNNSLYAGSSSYHSSILKWTGDTWMHLETDSFFANCTSLSAMTTDNAGNIYASGGGSGYLMKWDGSQWARFGTKLGGSSSIATDKNNNLYAEVTSNSTGSYYYYVAKWDGSSWSELGGSISFLNNKGVVKIVSDANADLYVGGVFKSDTDRAYVAKWDGTAWHELNGVGTGQCYIRDLAIDGYNNLYALVESGKGDYVTKWDGVSWTKLDKGYLPPSFMFHIAADKKGNVYVTGQYAQGGNNPPFVALYPAK